MEPRTLVTFIAAGFPDDAQWTANGSPLVPEGRAIADVLVTALRARGLQVSDATQHEFYGWCFEVAAGGFESRGGFRRSGRGRRGRLQLRQELFKEGQLVGIELLGGAAVNSPQELMKLLLHAGDEVVLLPLGVEQFANQGVAGGQIIGQASRQRRGRCGRGGGRGGKRG